VLVFLFGLGFVYIKFIWLLIYLAGGSISYHVSHLDFSSFLESRCFTRFFVFLSLQAPFYFTPWNRDRTPYSNRASSSSNPPTPPPWLALVLVLSCWGREIVGLVAMIVCMVAGTWGQDDSVFGGGVRCVRNSVWVGRRRWWILGLGVVRHNDVVSSCGLAVMKKQIGR